MKSERWGKMVERYLAKVKGPDAGFLYPHEAVTLLRREHARVVRAVKQLDKMEFKNMSSDFQAGQHNAFKRLLAILDIKP